MKKRNIILIISLSLIMTLALTVITSCDLTDMAGNQNQLQIFASTATTTPSITDKDTNDVVPDESQTRENHTTTEKPEEPDNDQNVNPHARTDPKAMDTRLSFPITSANPLFLTFGLLGAVLVRVKCPISTINILNWVTRFNFLWSI